MKKEIRNFIHEGLREITGNDTVGMQYENYDEQIVLRYGVILEGWTAPRWANPSSLSNSVDMLKTLRDALLDGSCYWRKLSQDELKTRREGHMEGLRDGSLREKPRKIRSDVGQSRKRKSKAVVDSDEDNEDAHHNSLPKEPASLPAQTAVQDVPPVSVGTSAVIVSWTQMT